ncbi:CK1 family protein kinase [Trichomonas vaginalis G3]|uniref:non-specific serine/threonine protein kinase n=1 Tax=Trichomonas vaginalis (strain ATCC PRA-98 / G3) TaxID=412133 RepID=A2FFV9_TRIV3|nr:STKc CK1 domain-containing protein [Trichomonas vaginalis G3]EAX96220.1 CK1 family protein kinase [Trichomonas vaginalis G3]KAI5496647.1 STKc CK1 domain-containing protein [Trichomonas vaginalis G3]|eukprot:XP_001309150.1 CK1 family protein kinase [Trichomonas vaginalis G3]
MKVGERIGGGSYGNIFYAYNTANKKELALKIESEKTKRSQIFNEYRALKCLAGYVGIPKVYFETCYGNQNAFTMELLGDSLEKLFERCGRKFSLKTVLMLADQMIKCVQYIHTKSFIHRDIKPENFTIGTGPNSNVIYIIDFGLAKRYINGQTLTHIPYREGRSFTGTTRYGSINDHLDIEQSRRDDMESLAYTLIYFLKGFLPWHGCKRETFQIKLSTSVEELCEGLPVEFSIFLQDMRKLDFEEEPNYSKYLQLFRSLFLNSGFVYDDVYDWTLLPEEPPRPHFKQDVFNSKISNDDSSDSIIKTKQPHREKSAGTSRLSLISLPTQNVLAQSGIFLTKKPPKRLSLETNQTLPSLFNK